MGKTTYIKKEPLLRELQEFREKNDILFLHESSDHTLSVEVNHYGGLYINADGVIIDHHIGSEKCIDAYLELYKEMFDGKN
jgi:hypothetical protein